MTILVIRLIEYLALALAFGGMAVDLGWRFWGDYGSPWNRRAGSNGRWRTDGLLVVLVAVLSLICAVAAAALLFDGWTGAEKVTTVLLGVLAVTVVGVWLSGKAEHRKTEEMGAAAAARTERAADRAIVASDDTRRSAHRTEEAANKMIGRLGDREGRADGRDIRADERAVRADEREERMDERERDEEDRKRWLAQDHLRAHPTTPEKPS